MDKLSTLVPKTQNAQGKVSLLDAHVHLGFMKNLTEVAAWADAHDMGLVAVSVIPSEYAKIADTLEQYNNIVCALGIHPWWVAKGLVTPQELNLFWEYLPFAPVLGEVGLDFAPKHAPQDTQHLQTEIFFQICKRAAQASSQSCPKILSIHSVSAATQVLDILEDTQALTKTIPIFHWFSGTSAELARAKKAGCYFSVNAKMLATKKGKEYVRQLPLLQLLCETDEPKGENVIQDPVALLDELKSTVAQISALKQEDVHLVQKTLIANAMRVGLIGS